MVSEPETTRGARRNAILECHHNRSPDIFKIRPCSLKMGSIHKAGSNILITNGVASIMCGTAGIMIPIKTTLVTTSAIPVRCQDQS